MEHPCHQCGAPIEDGVPFCPRCNAPQIRVASERAEPSAAIPVPGDEPGALRPQLFAVEWKHMRRGSLPMAAALALLMISSPDLFWLWLPLAGATVVWLHRMRTSEPVSTRAGLRIGAFTGMVAFALFAAVLVSTVVYDRLLLERPDRVSEGSRKQLEDLAKRNPDPKVQEAVTEILRRPGGVTLYLLVGIPILFVLFLSLCATGGALAAAIMGLRSGP